MKEEKKIKKIRCCECGNIIAFEIEPIDRNGVISIMCNHRKPNGFKCKTVNYIKNDETRED